jgi:quercetin dioxygenase-like cupin family protein
MLENELGPGTLNWEGTLYKTVLTLDDSGGAMTITDSVSPIGSGPPMHIHHAEDEAFFVISGEIEFSLAGRRFRKGPGDAAFVPRGVEHTFTVVGDKPCRHLVILTPGGFEGFFAEMAKGQFRIPQDMDQVQQSAQRHNLEFTGPPISPRL